MRIAARLRLLSALLAVVPTLASADVTLTFVPVGQSVPLGQPATVEVHVLGTVDFAAPSVGAYDIDVAFDPSIVDEADFAFGTFLGNPVSLTAVDVATPGVVNFAETSLLAPAALDLLQPDAFPLGVLSFSTLAVGTTPLVFTRALLGDALANEITVLTTTGSITVVALPLPGTLALAACALACALASRRSCPRPAPRKADSRRAARPS